jgi:hypothetical protein
MMEAEIMDCPNGLSLCKNHVHKCISYEPQAPVLAGTTSGGPRILVKGMPYQNFGVSINNDFILKCKEEMAIRKYEKIIK